MCLSSLRLTAFTVSSSTNQSFAVSLYCCCRSAAIGYYVLEAKRLQPTLGVIGLNPSVVFRERLGANFALNFPTAHSASVESTRFCIDPRGMADSDNETMYIDSQFAGHLVSKEAKERCTLHDDHDAG